MLRTQELLPVSRLRSPAGCSHIRPPAALGGAKMAQIIPFPTAARRRISLLEMVDRAWWKSFSEPSDVDRALEVLEELENE